MRPLLDPLSIQSNTTPSQYIDRIKTLCRPLLEEIHSNHPSFKWAGISSPVNKNTESSNSNVNIVIGFSPDADFFDDLDEGLELLEDRLPEALGMEVGVAGFIQQTETTQYVDMGALLTARTIWGDISWLDINQGVALDLLQQGYAKIKEADDLMSNAQRTLSAIQAELMSPEHEALRLSILQEALSVIHLIKMPFASLQLLSPSFLAQEKPMKACLQGNIVDQQALEKIWATLSKVINPMGLKTTRLSMEATFNRAGLVPSGCAINGPLYTNTMVPDLRKVGLTNELYSAKEEALIRQALIDAEKRPIELKEHIARYRTALAPHKRLPEDVLRCIFTLVCGTPVLQGDPHKATTYAAMILSYVCSVWRRIVLDMPRLWTRVYLFIQPYSESQTPLIRINNSKIRFAKMWLARGGSMPRELFVHSGYDRSLLSDQVQQLIAPYPYRNLSLLLEQNKLQSLSCLPAGHMSSLETLYINCRNSNKPGIQIHLPLPAHLPNLTRLSLCRCFAGYLDKLITAVPWHSLKYLRLEFRIPSTTCLNVILRQGMSLINCHLLAAMDSTFSNLHIAEPLVLPKMRYLNLICGSEADARIFDRAVVTPAVSKRIISNL